MRIIAGEFRHRAIHSPPDSATTRPIPDRVKESLFGILRGHLEGASVADVFAGTGSIGLEAVSRGAASVVMYEKDRRAAELIQQNIQTLGCDDRCEVVKGDALGLSALARAPRPLHLVFFDPPYPMMTDPAQWVRVRDQFARFIGLLDDSGYAVLRTPWPFRHADAGEPAAGPPHLRLKQKKHAKPRRHVDRVGEKLLSVEEAMALSDEELDDATPGDVAPVARHNVDLHIAGATGPETHIYGSMGVHLYMKARPS